MVTVQIKENSKQAKKFLEYIKTLPFVEFKEKKTPPRGKEYPVSKNVPNAETLHSMEKTSKGIGLTKTKSHQDLLDKLYS